MGGTQQCFNTGREAKGLLAELAGRLYPLGNAEQKKKVGEEGNFVPTRSELCTGFGNSLAPGTTYYKRAKFSVSVLTFFLVPQAALPCLPPKSPPLSCLCLSSPSSSAPFFFCPTFSLAPALQEFSIVVVVLLGAGRVEASS